VTRAGVAKVLFDAPTIGARVGQLAAEVAGDYVGEAVLLVGVLKGSTPFLADLVRKLGLDASVDFMAISSYGAGGPRSGIVRILKDLDSDIGGRHVLIVEDIVDTGLTLTYLRRTLAARRPASLRTITLLDKAARRIVPVPVDYRGFEIADVFVVGYGLDWQGRYRNLRDLLAVDDVARLDPSALDERLGDAYGSRGVRFAP
jgi:hypoxanthine phosphoribosyltransferase